LLEGDDELDAESGGRPIEGVQAWGDAASFQAGDGRLGAAHAPGQLALAEVLGFTQRSELLAKLERSPGALLAGAGRRGGQPVLPEVVPAVTATHRSSFQASTVGFW
jgi:hypothetical protein